MRLGKTPDDFRHVAVGIIVRRADAQRTFQPVVVKGGYRFVVEADDPPRIVQQLLALGGQPVAAPVLLEKLLADPVFQTPHLHGNRRLRLEDAFGGTREAAGIGNGDEGLQLVDIEGSGHGGHP